MTTGIPIAQHSIVLQKFFNERLRTVSEVGKHLLVDQLVVVVEGHVAHVNLFSDVTPVDVLLELWHSHWGVLDKVVNTDAALFFYVFNCLVEFLEKKIKMI